MGEAPSPPRRVAGARPWAIGAAHVALSIGVFVSWLGLDLHLRAAQQGVTAWREARLPDLVAGTAGRPYVLRALVPVLVRVTSAVVPARTQRRVSRHVARAAGRLSQQMLTALAWDEDDLFQYLVAAGLAYGSLLASSFAIRSLYAHLHPGHLRMSEAVGLVALAALPLTFRQGAHFFYDFPTLLLWAVALLLLLRPPGVLYYVVFALAVLNKETSALITVVFALAWWDRLPRAAVARHVLFQIVIWMAIRGAVLYIFRDNPGETFERNMALNLSLMASRTSVPHLILFGSLLAAAIALPREHRLLRATFAILGPLVAAYFVVGKYGEIRFFYEAYPASIILVCDGFLVAAGCLRSLRRATTHVFGEPPPPASPSLT